MSKGEFLEGLRERLSGEIPEYKVQEHLRYYDNYLSEQILKGKTEEEATAMLGSPYLIAKTILDMEEPEEETVEQDQSSYAQEERRTQNYSKKEKKAGKWQFRIFILVLVIIAVALIFALGSLMALLIRFLFPLMLIGIVIYLFKKSKNGS